MFLLVLFAIGLAILIYKTLIKPLKYWENIGIPQYSVWFIWKETIMSLAQRRVLLDGFEKIRDDFKGHRYFGTYQFTKPVIIITDPELIKSVTVKDFDHFVDHSQIIPTNSEPLLEKNLIGLKGDQWRDMRSALSPSFTSNKMKMMFGVISDCAKEFSQYFEEHNERCQSINMKDAFTKFTNDVIASSAFGINCDSMRNPDNAFYLMGKEVTNATGFWRNLKMIFVLILPKVAKIFGWSIIDEKVTKFFTTLVTENIRTREREGIIRHDMIHLLMEARKGRSKQDKYTEDVADVGYATVDDPTMPKEEKRKKEEITDKDIVAQALIFFFAGFETVSQLMCFMAHELAVNPDVQERLQSEIDNTLNDCEESLTYEALSKMKYMDMVVSESLRKWPPVLALDRMCVKPYTILPSKDGAKPYHLKKGDQIFIPLISSQRDPELFPNPDRFDPERFSDENKFKIVPYTYLSFGTGPRSCIGNRFAIMEVKLAFFHILSKFNITVVEKTSVPLKLAKGFQVMPEGGFWLGFKSRNVT